MLTMAATKTECYTPYLDKSTRETDLPEHNSLENLFQRHLSAERRQLLCERESRQRSPPVRLDVTNDARVDNKAGLPSGRQDPEIQRQMDEVDRHRETVQKMSRKIIELHTKMSELQKQNGDLRHQLDSQLYDSKPDLDRDNPDQLSRDELASRYSIVKNKLHRQAATLTEYKQKVVELQKKLIEKNEQEKKYLKKQEDSFQPQTDCVQRTPDDTDRSDGMNDVSKKQSRKLERLVSSRNSHNNDELLDMRQQLQASQQRIKSLEKQMAENARRWSREKTDLSVQLQEARHGLARQSLPHRLSPIPSLSDVKPAHQQQQLHRYRHSSNHSSTHWQ